MVEGMVVTILSCLVIVWIGFSMAGRDEARVSASADLSKWYKYKHKATIVAMEEVEVERNYVTLVGRGVHKQWGYKLTLEYKNRDDVIVKSTHTFYDESEQDEEFLERYIKDNTLYVWMNDKSEVYVQGKRVDSTKLLTVYGSDKVLVYTLSSAVVIGMITTLFLMFIAPVWIVFHIPLVVLAGVVPQLYMYIQTVNSNIQRRDYVSVSSLNQNALYIDKEETGLKKVKLVEQTLPMVLLEEGVG